MKSSSEASRSVLRALLVSGCLLIATEAMAEMANPLRIAQALPQLTSMTPDSGPAGEAYPVQVTISGSGFMPSGNVVEFGPVKIADIPSTEPGRLVFLVPKVIPSRGEVPPMVMMAGEYRVSVITPAGKSNALVFRLTHS